MRIFLETVKVRQQCVLVSAGCGLRKRREKPVRRAQSLSWPTFPSFEPSSTKRNGCRGNLILTDQLDLLYSAWSRLAEDLHLVIAWNDDIKRIIQFHLSDIKNSKSKICADKQSIKKKPAMQTI